jgi:hypothetical protein
MLEAREQDAVQNAECKLQEAKWGGGREREIEDRVAVADAGPDSSEFRNQKSECRMEGAKLEG